MVINDVYEQAGFTLIEVMIVITIIGILVAIALPTFSHLINNSYLNGCYKEAKDYSSTVFYTMSSQVDLPIPKPPDGGVCISIEDATLWSDNSPQEIIAIPKNNNSRIVCDLSNGLICKVVED